CNVPIGIRMGLARLLEVDASRVHVDFAGLNHMVYGLDVYLDGVSVMDRVLELVTDPEKQITMENIAALNWEPDFIRGLRAIPCPYHRYYYKTREMLEEEKEASVEKGTRAEVV
ncbi:6-phospho-beta-glucosidase, partial [Escherichia coli]|nr:6-phospho-beta-glucosidase [Escherichia coli]